MLISRRRRDIGDAAHDAVEVSPVSTGGAFLSTQTEKRQAAFSPRFEASRDGFLDIGERFVAGFALTDAAGDGRAFDDPDAIFIPVQCGHELHKRAAATSERRPIPCVAEDSAHGKRLALQNSLQRRRSIEIRMRRINHNSSSRGFSSMRKAGKRAGERFARNG
jgi:hypothetical protein